MADKLEADYIPRWRRTPDTAEKVEFISRSGPMGSVEQAIANSYFGINHRSTPGMLPINRDNQGLTFFTRPMLNLTDDNLRMSRLMAPLLTTNSKSLPRIIRCLLDPELAKATPSITSEFVNPRQAFIPILTNTLMSIGGWPDIAPQSFTAPEGNFKETYGFVDSVSVDYSAYDITATFRNVQGDPITALFFHWLHYASLVFRNIMMPYPQMILENEIDYFTRIYRIVLDPTRRYVQKIGATGGSYPANDPMGAAMNFEYDQPYNQANAQLSITFKSFGAIYNDYRLIQEFNNTVITFNDEMSDEKRGRSMVQIHPDRLQYLNNQGYPRIDPNTLELQWYLEKAIYEKEVLGIKESKADIDIPEDLELPGIFEPNFE